MTYLFVSTNLMWGGSEVLWYNAAKKLQEMGHSISVLTYYDAPALSIFKNRIVAKNRFKNIPQTYRLLGIPYRKSTVTKLDVWSDFIDKNNPLAAVLSQGNNTGSLSVLQFFLEKKISFITVSQLISEHHYLQINQDNLNVFQKAYSTSKLNCFVSNKNLELHSRMMGFPNSTDRVIQNPITNRLHEDIPFPKNEVIHIAFVGRIEALHKGLDHLLEIARMDKWKSRSVIFNLYGSGPHEELVKSYQSKFNLQNVILHGHAGSIREVWTKNHILFLPSRMEGQSLALLEALWCGRPAVTTNVGGAEELIIEGQTGFISENNDFTAIENALDRAWESRGAWESIGQAAKTKVRSAYHLDAVDEFVKLVSSTLNP
jgi:glycosyltransferase involved in cell wall biosynthesis